MADKNLSFNNTPWSDGQILYAADLNSTVDSLAIQNFKFITESIVMDLQTISGTGVYTNRSSMFGDAYFIGKNKSTPTQVTTNLFLNNSALNTGIGSVGIAASYEHTPTNPANFKIGAFGSFTGSISATGFFTHIIPDMFNHQGYNVAITKNASIVYFKSGASSGTMLNMGSYTNTFVSGDVFSIWVSGTTGSIDCTSGTTSITGSGFTFIPGIGGYCPYDQTQAGVPTYCVVLPSGQFTQTINNLSGNNTRLFTNFVFQNGHTPLGSYSVNYLGSIINVTNQTFTNISGLVIANGGSAIITANIYNSGTQLTTLVGYGGRFL